MSPKEFEETTRHAPHHRWQRCAAALIALAGVIGCGPEDASVETGEVQEKTIYGPKSTLTPSGESWSDEFVLKRIFDDRRDVFDEERPPPGKSPTRGYSWLRSYAEQAGIVFFHKSAFVKDPLTMAPDEEVQFQGTDHFGDVGQGCQGGLPPCLGEGGHGPLCQGENFFFDPHPMSPTVGRFAVACSGTLIDDDLVSTAGHCVERDRVPPRSCNSDTDCDRVPGQATEETDPECYGVLCPAGSYSTLDRHAGEHPCDLGTHTCVACNDDLDCIGPRTCKAGKCELQDLKEAIQLSEMRVAFNYYKVWPNTLHAMKAKDIFRPKSIEARSSPVDMRAEVDNINRDDFAIVRIERAAGAADGFVPVPVRQDRTLSKPMGTNIPKDTPVGVMGAPGGIPMKLATDRVTVSKDPNASGSRRNREFGASLDSASGNSGSGVFDMNTMTLAGILVSGPTDYQPRDPANPNGCWEHVYCSDTQPGINCGHDTNIPQVPDAPLQTYQTHISIALDALCNNPITGVPTPQNSPRLCLPETYTPNSTCQTAQVIPVESGREITLSGDTTPFPGDPVYHPGCDLPGSTNTPRNAYFQFTLDRPSLVYADTFESEFDTVLALTANCGAPELVCNDDNVQFGQGYAQPCDGPGNMDTTKSRLQLRVGPGLYNLVVSGFDGARGKFQLHFQVLPDSFLAVEDFPRGGTFLAAGTSLSQDFVQPSCSAEGGRDIANYFATCPDYPGGLISANTCNPTTTWDTVISTRQGNRFLEACSDDILLAPCVRQTLLSPVDAFDVQKFITAGSGIRGIYVDGWGPNDHGFYQLELTVP